MKPNGRPPLVSDAVQSAIAAAPGSRFADLFAVLGGLSRSLTTTLARLRASNEAHAVGGKSHLRYFATADLAAQWVAHLPVKAPSMKRRWTPEDDAAMLEHYPTNGAAFVANLLGRDINATTSRASSKGIACLVRVRNGKVHSHKPAKTQEVALRHAGSSVRIEGGPSRLGPAYLPGELDTLPRSPGFKHTICESPKPPTRTNTFMEA